MSRTAVQNRLGHFVNEAARIRFMESYERAMQFWPSPREEFDVPTSFGSTRVYAHGAGDSRKPVVVLLHGQNATAASWHANVGPLAEHFAVYAVETLGEPGMSVQSEPIVHAEQSAEWLAEVLDRLGLTRVHLVGLSYGGWLAANHALRRGDQLASLTLLDPAAVFAGVHLPTLLHAALAGLLGVDSVIRKFIIKIRNGSRPSEAQMRLLVDAMRTYRVRLPPPLRFGDADLRSIRVPSLVLFGAKSAMHNSHRAAERARRLLRDVRVNVLAGTGHGLPSERTETVNADIVAFVRSITDAER